MSDRSFQEALTAQEESLALTKKIFGERSRKVSGKMYMKANCLFNMGKRSEAKDVISQCIEIHDNADPDLKPEWEEAKEEGEKAAESLDMQLQLNRIQYQNFLSSILFMNGDYLETVESCNKGLQLC